MKNRYVKYMVFSILFFSAISIVYQIAVVENPGFNIYDLAVNMLSEFAGMIFTVLIFNEFITYRQQLTNTNKLKLLYNEVEELFNNLDFPFRSAAVQCVDDPGENLWTKEVIDIIRDKTMLSEVDDCVFPAVPWYMIFSMQGEKIIHKCDNIKIQFQDILEPQILGHLFYLLNDSEMLTDLTNIRIIYESDFLLNYSRPKNLGSYFACPTDKDFEVIKQMKDWIIISKKENETQTANAQKYSKIILCILVVIFAIGTVGYYVNGRYLSGTFFSALTAVLCLILAKLIKTNRG